MSPKVSVNSLRGRLYLLSRFPRKDGAPGLQQQRIPLGLPDTAADRKVAEKRRARVQREVDQGTFSWADWTEPTAGVTWRQAIDQLYRKRVVNGRTGESTWQINYMGRLRQLPMTQPVTAKSIAAAMQKYDRDQCSYKELYYLLKDLCQLIAVPFPQLPVPTYTTGKTLDVPSVTSNKAREGEKSHCSSSSPCGALNCFPQERAARCSSRTCCAWSSDIIGQLFSTGSR